ncbi:hypothetical protein ACFO1B_04460 [Dactylosporangium siamense]|uniref:DUF4367 domain-containing protein n=1 Tax=Dactylosporangium siamense TaxID=685454 RepID=A0A919PGK5_9ACTN|nr:hypothetical protein [Dactylosporangium siamense]GIG42861.1 hypothetical protein Dsi01nite_009020 [Dactylosporangium siamense]
MSDEEQVIDLLDRATASVPAALLEAPHAAIRRRVRRRRAAGWTAAAAAALLIIAGFAVARPGPAAQMPAAPGAAPAATSAQEAPGVPWLGARIDRTGTRLTVYAVPLLGKCVAERDPNRDDLVLDDDRVTVQLDGIYTGCADDTQVTSRTFTLPQALGDRFVVDGRSPRGQPFLFSDKDVPDFAAGGWSEQKAVWLNSGAAVLQLYLTRPGGPDLIFTPARWQPEPDGRVATPDHTLTLGDLQIDVYNRPGQQAAGWFSSHNSDVRFMLTVAGNPLEKDAFDALLRGMTWA